jgi:hypothetical protein
MISVVGILVSSGICTSWRIKPQSRKGESIPGGISLLLMKS